MRNRSLSGSVASALVLASFLFMSVAATAGHTDDGCVVEIHCVACQWAMATTGNLTQPPCPSPVFEVACPVLTAVAVQPVEAPTLDLVSRGPPSL